MDLGHGLTYLENQPFVPLSIMAAVSSKTLALYRVCTLWACALFLFKNPVTIYSNFAVVILGQALELPNVYTGGEGDKLAGIVAVLLILLGIEEFVVIFQENSGEHWRGSVPTRLTVYFALTLASYLGYRPLANSLAFTYVFLELVVNFFMYLILREELNEVTRRTIREERGQNPTEVEGAL